MYVFDSRLCWICDNGSTYQSQLEGWQTHHSFTKDEENEHDRAQVIVHIGWKPIGEINLLIFQIVSEIRLQIVNRIFPNLNEFIVKDGLVEWYKNRWNKFQNNLILVFWIAT